MLNTRFPRLPGDIGNPGSIPWRSTYDVVELATTGSIVVGDGIAPVVTDALMAAAERLVLQGATLLTTTCGFLVELQQPLQQHIRIPVVTSSLLLLPLLRQTYGQSARLGVMTFDARKLSPRHLELAGQVPFAGSTNVVAGESEARTGVAKMIEESGTDTLNRSAVQEQLCILGMQDSRHFYPMIHDDHPSADVDKLRADVLQVAEGFVTQPVDALVLECTNLSPFKTDLQQHLNIQVFDIFDLLSLLLPAPAR